MGVLNEKRCKTPPIEIAQKTLLLFNLYRTGFETHHKNHFWNCDIFISPFIHCFRTTKIDQFLLFLMERT
jgi:hypothetical protein